MNRKRGFALAATIFALLLLGELVSWGLLVSLAETREGMASLELERAFESAEEGLARILADVRAGQEAGESVFRGQVSGRGSYEGSVVPMGSGVLLVRVEGRFGRGLARVKIAQIGRILASGNGKSVVRKLQERGWVEVP